MKLHILPHRSEDPEKPTTHTKLGSDGVPIEIEEGPPRDSDGLTDEMLKALRKSEAEEAKNRKRAS